MTLGTIIGAIVRPYIAKDDETIWIGRNHGAGFGISTVPIQWLPRATVRRIGDLEIAYWGRDTLVHPAPEAP